MCSSYAYAANSDIIDHVLIQVPTACTLTGTGMDSHNATINSGQYNSAIGETTMKVVCNDQNGFAIYAIGYTDDIDGKNVLTNSALGSSYDISTGTGTTGNSQWAMKLSTISSPTPSYPITILNSFNNFHTVPDDYTLVAKRESATDTGDNPEGSVFKTTYQVYVSTNQAPGAYNGQVKYTLVHPHSNPIPNDTMLDTGTVVAGKMKTLAAGTETAYNTKNSDIKAIRMADSLPANFVATTANTVSTAESKHPIYIFYDNTNDAGIMYFYSGGYQVVMNPESSNLFRSNLALSDISGLSTWDSSRVTTMRSMFIDSTIALTNIDALANWDTSSVEDMYGLFHTNTSTITAGYHSHLEDISAVTTWNTSNASIMRQTFGNTKSLVDISPLSLWNVSAVEDMRAMFAGSSIANVDALSGWDVSNVEDMQGLFMIGGTEYSNGYRSSLSDISGIANWNTANVTNMNAMFQYAEVLTAMTPIINWDVGSVTATAGDSSSNNNFYNMFKGFTATLVPFTLRAGTWNSAGTYIPSS